MAKSAAERKRKEREAKKAHLEDVGAKPFKMVMYTGTRECLDQLKATHGFEDDGEIMTLLIHNLKDCDMSRQKESLSVPQQKTA